jgi:periplasmic protein TonB
VVISLVIAPDGTVTGCSIVSSSFADPDLEQKILQRVRMINFGAENVPVFSYPDYPISFLAS